MMTFLIEYSVRDPVRKSFFTDDGVSIPASYTSYLSPIQSPKLYCEVQQWKDTTKENHVWCLEYA